MNQKAKMILYSSSLGPKTTDKLVPCLPQLFYIMLFLKVTGQKVYDFTGKLTRNQCSKICNSPSQRYIPDHLNKFYYIPAGC